MGFAFPVCDRLRRVFREYTRPIKCGPVTLAYRWIWWFCIHLAGSRITDLLLLRKSVHRANVAIARAWFGHDGILVLGVRALFWQVTDHTEMNDVVAGLTVDFPEHEENHFFLKHELGVCADTFAARVLGYTKSFKNGLLKSLLHGQISLLSLTTFTTDDPLPGSLPLSTYEKALSTESLFHVWEVRNAVFFENVYSSEEACLRGVHVFRFNKLFAETRNQNMMDANAMVWND